jgi:hypothetical protein
MTSKAILKPSETGPPNVIVDLPSDLLFYICSFLETEELLAVAQVNKSFKAIVDDCRAVLKGEVDGVSWKVSERRL